MNRRILLSALVLVLLTGSAIVVWAEVPQLINYQGVLYDKSGHPAPDGSYDMVFKIYDTPTGTAHLWTSGTQSVPVKSGVYTYLLGSNAQLPHDLFATDTIRWLGLTVGTDPEIDPRFRLTTTPYAYHALRADTANVALTSVGGAGGWIDDGDVVKLANSADNVGVGINLPQAKLHLIQDFYSDKDLFRAETDIPMGARQPGIVVKRDGRTGIRTADPLSLLHIESNDISLGASAIGNDRLLIEGSDASMGIYCEPEGPDGAAINLGQLSGGSLVDKWSLVREKSAVDSGGGGLRFTYGALADPFGNNTKLRINTQGNVAMGRLDPGDHRLYVESYGSGVGGATAFISNTNPDGIGLFVENDSPGLTMIVSQKGQRPEGEIFRCDSWTNGWHPVFRVLNNGRTILRGVLEIRDMDGATLIEMGEGLDYAEGFDVAEHNGVEPGAVLVIDPENPGKLALSNRPYDRTVAGIAAGANELGSGVRLGAGQFDFDVALAGRVYCNVDASYGAIQTGDLLTTSPTPGYAMKVSDYTQAQGAIVGKAMQSMEQGQRGQILVLVTLQ